MVICREKNSMAVLQFQESPQENMKHRIKTVVYGGNLGIEYSNN